MIQHISERFGNLPIRRKLTLGFSLLIALLLLVILSNLLIERLITDPASASLKDAGDDMLLASRVGFEFERARYEQRIFETYYRGSGFDKEPMTAAFEVVMVHLNNALALLNTPETSHQSSEEAERVEALRVGLENYTANFQVIVEEMLPARGSATTGLGADIYGPLEQINNDVDATALMKLIEEYVDGFGPDALLAFSQATADLSQRIEDADLPDERKETLQAQLGESQEAMRALLAFDAQLLQRYMAIGEATETLANQTISEYIAIAQQEQLDAQDRMERANHLRATLAWVIGILTVLLALAMGQVISKSVSQPITALSKMAQKVAEGDYTQRAVIRSSDEVGQLALSFNGTVAAVSEREAQLREQADQLRVATARAREAARVKGEFLANVSHELRTPLNAIIGFSDMLLMGMNGELNEKQSHKVRRLRENGMRLLDLINDILDLTRIEARRTDLVCAPFAPHALLTRIGGQMEVLAHDKGLAFTTEIAPDLPTTLVGDEKRIEQIIVNLLSNAFKFTQQGSVVLQTRANLADRTWTISVRDTGVGIPPHARNLIFEEFRQLDGSSTRAFKGSGLGLAITRGLVRMMGGEITVESELGKGSTFIVTLPLDLEESSLAGAVIPAAAEA